MPIRLDSDDEQPSQQERRASARLEVISRIQGEADTGAAVLLLNISDGGALVQCEHPVKAGEIHEFRFSPAGAGAPVVFAARVIHVLSISAADGRSYALGLEFVTATERQKAAVSALIATATRIDDSR